MTYSPPWSHGGVQAVAAALPFAILRHVDLDRAT